MLYLFNHLIYYYVNASFTVEHYIIHLLNCVFEVLYKEGVRYTSLDLTLRLTNSITELTH
jgi:hypothetical protein